MAPLELVRQPLLQLEIRIDDAFAHLGVILESHGGNGVGVGLARCGEIRERVLPPAMAFDAGVEHQTILETGVHALAVEGNDGMRGIADERGDAAHVPAVGINGAQKSGRVMLEFGHAIRHERTSIRKILRQESIHRLR